MRQYLLIAKNTWIETFTYRLNFVMWRLRVTLELLTRYFLWLAIIPKDANFLNYSQGQMLTYILATAFVSAIVVSTKTADIAADINQGSLSNFLIKPMNYFLYWFSRDIGDKLMNIFFMTGELTLFFIIFNPPFLIQTNPFLIFAFIISTFLAVMAHFYISFSLSLIGFFNPEVWAPRFIFFVILMFFSGQVFPLDILPSTIFSVVKFLPFTYLVYFPVKIYLGNLEFAQICEGLTVAFIWTIALYFSAKFFWQKGLKFYTAYGK